MPLIICKVELSLDWYTKCIIIIAETVATFVIRDAKLSVPVSVPFRFYPANENIRECLDTSFQGVSKLFVIAYQCGDDIYVNEEAFNKYFLPKITIEKFNIELDGINFYDQAINDSTKQYEEVRKISTGQGNDYTTGWLFIRFCLF